MNYNHSPIQTYSITNTITSKSITITNRLFIFEYMALQCIENTPSVYFHFDDYTDNKTNFSPEFLFELSCTNEKHRTNMENIVDPSVLDLGQALHHPSLKNLKTEQFFQEFDTNFLVTFEEEPKHSQLTSITNFPSSVQHRSTASVNHNQTQIDDLSEGLTDPNGRQIKFKREQTNHDQQIDDLQHISLSVEPNLNKQAISVNIERNFQEGLSNLQQQILNYKQKGSPIPAFQVKKRTVFKNKQNIVTNAQQFKITKKKIINQNTLQIFMGYPKSCKLEDNKKITQLPLYQTSKLSVKDSEGKRSIEKQVVVDRKYKSSIFQVDGKKHRQVFRSTTLDNWKRKFYQQKKSLQEKTVKRTSIFQKPFSLI